MNERPKENDQPFDSIPLNGPETPDTSNFDEMNEPKEAEIEEISEFEPGAFNRETDTFTETDEPSFEDGEYMDLTDAIGEYDRDDEPESKSRKPLLLIVAGICVVLSIGFLALKDGSSPESSGDLSDSGKVKLADDSGTTKKTESKTQPKKNSKSDSGKPSGSTPQVKKVDETDSGAPQRKNNPDHRYDYTYKPPPISSLKRSHQKTPIQKATKVLKAQKYPVAYRSKPEFLANFVSRQIRFPVFINGSLSKKHVAMRVLQPTGVVVIRMTNPKTGYVEEQYVKSWDPSS